MQIYRKTSEKSLEKIENTEKRFESTRRSAAERNKGAIIDKIPQL